MFYLFAMLGGIAFCAAPVILIVAIIQSIRKKNPKKWWGIFALSLVLFVVFELIAGAVECEHEYELVDELAPTCTEQGYFKYHCEKCDRDKTDYVDELEHNMKITSRVEPTENLEGEIIRTCSRCGHEEVETVEKLEKETEIQSSESQTATTESEEETQVSNVDTSVTFDEIYKAYKENELRADDSYKYNRYRITAKVNGMSTGGLLNMTGGATLTMEIRVDSTIVFFYAEFEKEQEEALKTINVGDTITFDGECLSAGSWVDCELVTE